MTETIKRAHGSGGKHPFGGFIGVLLVEYEVEDWLSLHGPFDEFKGGGFAGPSEGVEHEVVGSLCGYGEDGELFVGVGHDRSLSIIAAIPKPITKATIAINARTDGMLISSTNCSYVIASFLIFLIITRLAGEIKGFVIEVAFPWRVESPGVAFV